MNSRRDCLHPEKSRPGGDFVGIGVFATVRKFGLPIEVLADREQRQDRYSFVYSFVFIA